MKKVINIPIYECKVEFHLCTKEEADKLYKRLCKKHKLEYDNSDFYGTVLPQFNVYYMIVVKEGNIVNSFMHEMRHLVDFITSDRDIEDSEAKAYLQGMLGENLIKYVL